MIISDFVKGEYLAYFQIKFGEQDKSWVLHQVCKAMCRTITQVKKNIIIFVSERLLIIIIRLGRNSIYPNLDSAICPVPLSEERCLPAFTQLPSLEDKSDTDIAEDIA